MDLELRDKRVLITGGSKGIGFACAKAFAAEGARVALASRSPAHLAAAANALDGALTIAVDLTDAAAAAAMVDRVERELGAIDVLVNSAGAAARTAPADLTAAAWHAAMDAKFFTYVHAIDPVIARMAARGAGAIVNIIGSGGKTPTATHLPGGAANAGLMLVTAGLASAYGPRGVRVVGINPGLTKTDRVAAGIKVDAEMSGIDEAEAMRRSVSRVPLGRLADPEEIADMAVFAASARASYLTGAIITMDGAATPMVV